MKNLILSHFPFLTFSHENHSQNQYVFYTYNFGFGLTDYEWLIENNIQVLIEPKNGMEVYITFY